MRILIAEDDLTSRMVLKGVLERQGQEVVEASDGLEAFGILKRTDGPEMAVLDWMMPGMDGVELVRRVRQVRNEMPPYLILLTARGSKTDVAAGLDAGADDYVTKPFDSDELRARINAGKRILEFQRRLHDKVETLQRALDEIKVLRRIIPICARCKKVRDDQGYWKQVELYMREHTGTEFTHGICPDCIRALYPEYVEEMEKHKNP